MGRYSFYTQSYLGAAPRRCTRRRIRPLEV